MLFIVRGWVKSYSMISSVLSMQTESSLSSDISLAFFKHCKKDFFSDLEEVMFDLSAIVSRSSIL